MDLSEESMMIKEYVEKMLAYLKKDNIQELKRDDHPQYFEKMSSKFEQLKERIPSLFSMIIDLDNPDEFEMYRLNEMLLLRERMNGGKISEQSASKHIGNQYYNEFVRPHVDMSKERNHPSNRR